ncbi:MAG: hypothetical protein V7K53_23055 [Nostoc sp.]|uniref:hypothetical protein n=1 Tax=Nostoc sp. TaxID=1180 RepID=UPI002FF751B3
MTELIEQAIFHLQALSSNDQDAIALMILEELEDEVQWNKTFAKSQNFLDKVAGEAIAEYRAGKTQALNPDTL